MIIIENDCVGPCPQGCIHCGKERTPHFYCDNCGDEATLYEFDGEQLCLICIEQRLEVIEGS